MHLATQVILFSSAKHFLLLFTLFPLPPHFSVLCGLPHFPLPPLNSLKSAVIVMLVRPLDRSLELFSTFLFTYTTVITTPRKCSDF